MVFIYHVVIILAFSGLHGSPLRWLTQLGPQGVAIFFTLSGFLLSRPFLVAHLQGASQPSVIRFWFRRVVRIYPAYWVALVISVWWLHVGTVHAGYETASTFALVQTYRLGSKFAGIGIAWTLAVEMAFYASLPFLLAVPRLFAGRSASIRRKVWIHIVWLVALSASVYVARAWWTWWYVSRLAPPGTWFWPLDLPVWIVWYLDMFAIGMGVALLSAWTEVAGAVPRALHWVSRWPAALWLTAFAMYAWLSQLHLGGRGNPVARRPDLFLAAALHAVIAVMIVFPAAFDRGEEESDDVIRGALLSRPVRALGAVSYGVFLWHLSFVAKVVEWSKSGAVPDVLAAKIGLVALLSLLAATVSYWLLERPLLKWAHGTSRPSPPKRWSSSSAT
jgi:peptidoglycan/LPS O-acetylase OafA/YrhL